MMCSVCNQSFTKTLQVTLFEEMEKTEYASTSSKIVNLKTMCMECFLRVSGVSQYINVNDLPDGWFKKVVY